MPRILSASQRAAYNALDSICTNGGTYGWSRSMALDRLGWYMGLGPRRCNISSMDDEQCAEVVKWAEAVKAVGTVKWDKDHQ